MNPAPPVTKSIPVGGATTPPLSGIGASLCVQKPPISSTDGRQLRARFRKGFAACFGVMPPSGGGCGDRNDRHHDPFAGRRARRRAAATGTTGIMILAQVV